MKKKDIHIGSLIKEKLDEKSMTITEFANKINCERTTVYHIFKQKSIDIERLMNISEVLNYDFIDEVYKKQNDRQQLQQTVFIAVEIDINYLQQLSLPDGFIQLITKPE